MNRATASQRMGSVTATRSPSCCRTASSSSSTNAAAKLGAIATPINYHFNSEIEYIVDNSDAKAFVYDAQFVRPDQLQPLLGRLPR